MRRSASRTAPRADGSTGTGPESSSASASPRSASRSALVGRDPPRPQLPGGAASSSTIRAQRNRELGATGHFSESAQVGLARNSRRNTSFPAVCSLALAVFQQEYRSAVSGTDFEFITDG